MDWVFTHFLKSNNATLPFPFTSPQSSGNHGPLAKDICLNHLSKEIHLIFPLLLCYFFASCLQPFLVVLLRYLFYFKNSLFFFLISLPFTLFFSSKNPKYISFAYLQFNSSRFVLILNTSVEISHLTTTLQKLWTLKRMVGLSVVSIFIKM